MLKLPQLMNRTDRESGKPTYGYTVQVAAAARLKPCVDCGRVQDDGRPVLCSPAGTLRRPLHAVLLLPAVHDGLLQC